jgi:hypothetical protein
MGSRDLVEVFSDVWVEPALAVRQVFTRSLELKTVRCVEKPLGAGLGVDTLAC